MPSLQVEIERTALGPGRFPLRVETQAAGEKVTVRLSAAALRGSTSVFMAPWLSEQPHLSSPCTENQ